MLKERWLKLKQDEVSSFIYLKIIPIGGIFLVSRLFLAFRDLLVIWTFGVSQQIDTFILAFLIPYNITNIISLSYLNIFVPQFVKLDEEKTRYSAENYYFLSLLVLLSSTFIAVLSINLLYPFYSIGLSENFHPENLNLMRSLLYLTGLSAVISSICNFWREILNVRSKYLYAVSTSIIMPLVSIIFLIFDKKSGVYALTSGLLFGTILEASCLYLLLLKEKFNVFPIANLSISGFKGLFNDWWKLLLSKTFDNCVGLTDGIMAARYPQNGGLSSLNYGRKIVWLPIELACYAFAAISIPFLSQQAVKGNWIKFRNEFRKLLITVFLTTLPIVVIIFLFAEKFVKYLYEYGGFTADDTKLVSIILPYYTLHIPFFVVYYLMIRILPILNKNNAAILFSFLALLLTFVFNYSLISILGLPGIALSTFCVYLIVSLSLFTFIWKIIAVKLDD